MITDELEQEEVDKEEQESNMQDYQDMEEIINVRKVRISNLLVIDSLKKDNSVLTLDKAQQLVIPAPITLDDQPYITLVDCGASNTLISSAILQDIQATIIP